MLEIESWKNKIILTLSGKSILCDWLLIFWEWLQFKVLHEKSSIKLLNVDSKILFFVLFNKFVGVKLIANLSPAIQISWKSITLVFLFLLLFLLEWLIKLFFLKELPLDSVLTSILNWKTWCCNNCFVFSSWYETKKELKFWLELSISERRLCISDKTFHDDNVDNNVDGTLSLSLFWLILLFEYPLLFEGDTNGDDTLGELTCIVFNVVSFLNISDCVSKWTI